MLRKFNFTVIKYCPYFLEQVTIRVLHYGTYFKGYHFKYVQPQKALKPNHPSDFLWALKHNMSDIGNVPSKLEVLRVVLDDLKGTSVLANDLVSTCNTCLCSAAKEKCHILPLPMTNNIKSSLDKLLDKETLSSQNKCFCPSCDTLTESTKEISITKSSLVLTVELT